MGKFEEEYEKCFEEEDYSKKIFPMTLEGCVVRISDVIAYIGRDFEDAITVRLIKRKDMPAELGRILGNKNDKIINTLVLDLINNSSGKDYLVFSKDIFKALKDFMEFNYEYIYFNPKIKTQTRKIKNMFRQLFEVYFQDLKSKNESSAFYHYFLKNMNGNYHKGTHDKRKAIDFIAGMTDDFFNNQFKERFVPQSYGMELKTDGKKNI